MSASLPPDLRVLCRKLASIPAAQLPHALPSLTNHLLRCKDALAAPHDQKPKDDASQGSVLAHKLKTNITTLLNGRSREARFAAVGLIKAAVDVGGWEVLRGSEPWVRGLMAIVQKGDPLASKELAIVTLTKIYLLVHPYQTLVREVATPTIPAFATACLQLIKPKASGQPLTTPLSVVESICDAFSTLIPLYPATFRPFSSQIKSATRAFVAPTLNDDVFVPVSLKRAARRVNISLHYVAAKSSGSDEWANLLQGILRELHATADQVFRAIDESWESSSGHRIDSVELGGEPHGGGPATDQLPLWTGVHAGADRMMGLFHYLSDCLRFPTKAAVTVPITALLDAFSRICLIARLSPKSQTWDQALDTRAAIGRDEKDDLWSVIPDIHQSAMHLVLTMIQRLGKGMLPVVPEILDHLVRIFKSGMSIPSVRATGYVLLNQVLPFGGPTMSKAAVDMLEPLVGACCRDLQEDAGFLKPVEKPAASAKETRKNGIVTNADLFLQPQASGATVGSSRLDPTHKLAAKELLATILSNLPQHHLKPTLRGLLDKTAILTRHRDAMLSSVLNPYKDQRGRMYPSILPHLSRQYPHDQGLEVLRSNLRTGGGQGGSDVLATVDEIREAEEEDAEDEDEEMQDELVEEEPASEHTSQAFKQGSFNTASKTEVDLPIQSNPFEPRATTTSAPFGTSTRADSPPKRKHEGSDTIDPKRQELEKPASTLETERITAPQAQPIAADEDQEGEGSDDDDDASVHLNMELEDEDDEDE